MPRRPIIRSISFPELKLNSGSTVAIPIYGRRLSNTRKIEILLVGEEQAVTIPPEDWLQINDSLLIVKYSLAGRLVQDGGAELEITVTNDDGSDGTIYP